MDTLACLKNNKHDSIRILLTTEVVFKSNICYIYNHSKYLSEKWYYMVEILKL